MSTELSVETEFPKYTIQDLDERLDSEGNMIRWSDRYYSQGRLEGRTKGREEGLAEGKTAGRAEERLNNLQQILYGKSSGITAEQLEAVLKHRDEPDIFARIIKANTTEELLLALGQ